MVKICNRIIEYSFYVLFFLVPLVFAGTTSELFELNKMWLTWGLAIIIGVSWFTKMILQRRIYIQKTPLDIPIVLFLISQIVSTIFSWDQHVSFWGYYSRFNGGLLSILSYVFLYYAFLSNFDSQKLSAITHKLLAISLISGFIAALWGLPSHFGYDPTCFLFRGTFDVSCWTADFMPRVRIFSTLGQPAWLAAYLAILIPIAIAYFLGKWKMANGPLRRIEASKWQILLIAFFLSLIALFYIDLLFTQARSGVLGVWISLIFFFTAYIWIQRKHPQSSVQTALIFIIIFFILTFIIGAPITKLNKFTLPGLKAHFAKTTNVNVSEKTPIQDQNSAASSQQAASGGTESADIRLLVWKGGLEAWKNNPLFGTGVETFAYAYYKYKPAGQNLTSEWNFLYNKAHNEYVNYLTTTGAFGLGTYLLMIGWFIYLIIKQFKMQNAKLEKYTEANYTLDAKRYTLILALLAGFISILITNFFGFSVVITNIYLFLIPAFVLILGGKIPQNKTYTEAKINYDASIWQWTPIFFVGIAGLYMLIMLFRFWKADTAYALGYNLSRAGEYQAAYENLRKAVELREGEPVFKDELSINSAIIAASLITQKPASPQGGNQNDQQQAISAASVFIQEAINTSNEIISKFPNNAVFWKTRVRLFYTLSQVDSRYLPRALDAITKASLLAPQDTNILYNLGVLYGQNNNVAKGIEALEKTVKLKPDYRDARYALGLFYHEKALDKDGKMIDSAFQKKALDQMQYILDHLNPQDPGALESIKSWGK